MPVKGIGVDIEDISRFKRKPYTQNKTFYEKIFTSNEIKYCLSKSESYQHFTARFCAKEAFIKAINKDIKDYYEIEIIMKNNKPRIKFNEKEFLLSMSHDKNKAVAFVVIV